MSRVEEAIQAFIDDALTCAEYAEEGHLDDLKREVEDLVERTEDSFQRQIEDLQSTVDKLEREVAQLQSILEDQLHINSDIVTQFKNKLMADTLWIQEVIIQELPGAVTKILKRFISKTEEGGN